MASSSTSSIPKSFKYDMFLSFRGEDTRTNFTDHLYSALEQKNIYTYRDDERIKKGTRISDELMGSIEDSKFYIIVFSKNYASSSWCLDELVKIMECHKTTEHTAYPVFYDVEPSEVRKQIGAVGEAFAKHENVEAAGKWREAMKEAADLAGWELNKTDDGESPIQSHEELSGQVVRYTAGLPLTIRVLGSFLCGKNESEWIDALERLKTIPLNETLKKLELSYIGLEEDYKEIFLDVACILKGELKGYAIEVLESCGFHAKSGLRVLEQKSLITIDSKYDDERVGMHDHLEEMARDIVHRSHSNRPNKHSRLWDNNEIEDILANDLVGSSYFKQEKLTHFHFNTSLMLILVLVYRELKQRDLLNSTMGDSIRKLLRKVLER